MAKREKIHVSCEVVANPSDNLYFFWVFNSSSERLDLQENLISSQGSKSIAEHTPQVRYFIHLVILADSFRVFHAFRR